MRRVFLALLSVAFVVFFGGASFAQSSLPSLPGMGVVAKATHNQGPQTSKSVSTSQSSSTNTPTSNVGTAAKSSVNTDTVAPILKMPGSGSLPIIKDYRTASRSHMAAPDLLLVLAAIGSATALGMLWAVRRKFDRA